MNRSLLDTDIFSEVLKNNDATVRSRATAYLNHYGRFSISAPSVTEIVTGFTQAGHTQKLVTFRSALSAINVFPVGMAEADIAGQIIGSLAKIGTPIGSFDPLIAAVAITNGLVLVTGNLAHFGRLQSLGFNLQLDNWRIQFTT